MDLDYIPPIKEESEIIHDDVKIYPATISFFDPFEYRHYVQKLTIQNCGVKKAFVRILKPFSGCFYVKPEEHGVLLSPGLKIVKKIKFTYFETNSTEFTTLIVIVNGKQFEVILKVIFPQKKISVTPNFIDLELVNLGQMTPPKYIVLTNEDTRHAAFAVDAYMSDEIQIFLSPKKGKLEPKRSKSLSIQARGTSPGVYEIDIWIRCAFPTRLSVKCKVIDPALKISSPVKTRDFILLDFSYTYIGAFSKNYVCVLNYNTSNSVYCILGEWNRKICPYKEALDLDSNISRFTVKSMEGYFDANTAQIVTFIYTPKMSTTFNHQRNFESNFAVMQMIRLDCDHVVASLDDADIYSVPEQEQKPRVSKLLVVDSSLNYSLADTDLANVFSVTLHDTHFIRFCLHGIAKKPDVTCVPDFITLDKELRPRQKAERVLLIRNNCQQLPIIVQYKKVAFIDVIPSSKELKPEESIELTVVICPRNIGVEKQRIRFNLLFKPDDQSTCNVGSLNIPICFKCITEKKETTPEFNMGITPVMFGEVGRYVEDIRFNTASIKLPKLSIVDEERFRKIGTDELVAFPNDRPKSLRPWTNTVPIKTIFTGIPRLIEMEHGTIELEIKNQNNDYYTAYLRKQAMIKNKNKLPPIKDYDVTNKALLYGGTCKKITTKREVIFDKVSCSALTPLELFFVRITPRVLNLGTVAQMSCFNTNFIITNENPFPIDVRLRAPNTVSFVKITRFTIHSKACYQVKFAYSAIRQEGIINVQIDVIINDSSLVPVTLYGEVVKRTLNVTPHEVTFADEDDLVKHIHLQNPFTCPISFEFSFMDSSFTMRPVSGMVEAQRSLICMVKYNPLKEAPKESEFTLITEGHVDKCVLVKADPSKVSMAFVPQSLNLAEIPVNVSITHTVALENLAFKKVNLTIPDLNPHAGVTVYHRRASVKSKSSTLITINFKMQELGFFSFQVQVIASGKKFVLPISGTVLLPLVIAKPSILTFRKIHNHSFDTVLFTLENTSNVEAIVGFDLSEYREFTISESAADEVEIESVTLMPNSCRKLCMFFNPIDLENCSFFLPFIINGKYASELNANLFPKICVKTSVLHQSVCFSKTFFQFRYYPHPNFDTNNFELLNIFNPSNKNEAFCLRLDNLKEEISIVPKEPKLVEIREFSISADLVPGQSVSLELHFTPCNPCDFKIKLPVYVRDQMNGAVFKYIYICGYFPKPTLEVNYPIVYLEPVPLKTVSEIGIKLKATYHTNVCYYNAQCNDKDLKIVLRKNQIIDPRNMENIFDVLVKFSTNYSRILEERVRFHCTCGTECFVLIKGCSENCFITNHAFLKCFCGETMNIYSNKSLTIKPSSTTMDVDSMSLLDVSNIVEVAVNRNESSFPYFPLDDDENSEYAKHMKITLASVERWINMEGFYGDKWRCIPEGFLANRDQKGSDNFAIIVLLKNLAGSHIADQFKMKNTCALDPIIFVNYIYTTYSQVKTMLTQCGAFIPNVEPEYLLTYEQYLTYMSSIRPYEIRDCNSLVPLSFDKFNRLSIQNWLDLLLQTQKIFQLKAGARLSRTRSSLYLDDPEINLYNLVENFLLNWLETTYNTHRREFRGAILPLKAVRLFDFDLVDGTILAVVTASYCLYLIEEFEDFYWIPSCQNEIQHNACKLVEIWDKLHCRFKMKPWDIMFANSFDMLMFVHNLYDFLPGLIPIEDIEMEAPLSEKFTKSIEIRNTNHFPLKFTIHFFRNENECFSTDVVELLLPPMRGKTVDVTYHAKYYKKAEAYILFSGESKGFHLARNRVYHLLGKTDLSKPFTQIKFSSNTYQNQFVTQVIKSPYKVLAVYDLFLVEDITSNTADFDTTKLLAWKDAICLKMPRKLTFSEQLVCDENGVGQMNFFVSIVVNDCLSWYILFRSPTAGDFLVDFRFNVKVKKMWENAHISLGKSFIGAECLCTNLRNPNCPRLVSLVTNGKNLAGFECVKKCLLHQITDQGDMEFWSKYYATAPGCAILLRAITECDSKQLKDFQYILQLEDELSVKILGNRKDLVYPNTIMVYHLDSDFIEMKIHCEGTEVPEDFEMVWTSLALKIERFFKVHFELCD